MLKNILNLNVQEFQGNSMNNNGGRISSSLLKKILQILLLTLIITLPLPGKCKENKWFCELGYEATTTELKLKEFYADPIYNLSINIPEANQLVRFTLKEQDYYFRVGYKKNERLTYKTGIILEDESEGQSESKDLQKYGNGLTKNLSSSPVGYELEINYQIKKLIMEIKYKSTQRIQWTLNPNLPKLSLRTEISSIKGKLLLLNNKNQKIKFYINLGIIFLKLKSAFPLASQTSIYENKYKEVIGLKIEKSLTQNLTAEIGFESIGNNKIYLSLKRKF